MSDHKEYWFRETKARGRKHYVARPNVLGHPPTPSSTTSNWLYSDWILFIEKAAYNNLAAELEAKYVQQMKEYVERANDDIQTLTTQLAEARRIIQKQKDEYNDILEPILTSKTKAVENELAEAKAEIERLKEFEWMYKDLCK